MSADETVTALEVKETANEQLKRRFSSVVWAS